MHDGGWMTNWPDPPEVVDAVFMELLWCGVERGLYDHAHVHEVVPGVTWFIQVGGGTFGPRSSYGYTPMQALDSVSALKVT